MGTAVAAVAAAFWYVVGTTTAVVASTTGIALSLGAATVVAAGGLAIIGAAFSAAIDWAMPDIPTINTETKARLNKTLNPEEPRKMLFGETAASSDIRYWEAYGTDNKQYDEVIAVATHEIESFGAFYFETDLLTFDGSGDNLNQYGPNLNKKNRTVGITSTSLSAGAGAKWTTNSSMTGCAFYVLRFIYDQEVFPQGFPTRITQVVKGAKAYDPRLDSTNGGAGPHRVADQATWEYNSTVYQFLTNAEANGPWDSSDVGKDIEVAASTKTGTITSVSGTGPNYTIQYVLSGVTKTQFSASDVVRRVDATTKTMTLTASAPTTISSTDIGKNPALQILWYLLGWEINSILVAGMGVSSDDIDFASFITAANSCDTESYEGHCALSTGDSHERNLSLLRSSCGGTLIDTGGRYSFHPAIDDTGTIAATFDENDIVGSFSWVPKAKMRGQFNEVAGSFIDPGALYQKTAYPKVEDAAYVSADGFSKRRTVDFQTIQDSGQAQKLARILLNRTRFQGVFQASFNYKAMLVKNWDIVQLSFSPLGWTNELFRVVQQSITTDGQIILTLRQESSLIYAGGTINPALPSSAGSAWDASAKIDVVSLSATAITETGTTGTVSDGIKVSWTAPSSIVSFTEVQYKINADSDWIAAAILTQGETETKIVPAESGTLYDTRARHISISNVVGDWFTDTVTTGTDRDTAAGATAGAQLGVDVTDSGDAIVSDADALNVQQEWDDVQDANITRPEDNATVTGTAQSVVDNDFNKTNAIGSLGLTGTYWVNGGTLPATNVTLQSSGGEDLQRPSIKFLKPSSGVTYLTNPTNLLIPARVGDTVRIRAQVWMSSHMSTAGDLDFRIELYEFDANKDFQVINNWRDVMGADAYDPAASTGVWKTIEGVQTIGATGNTYQTAFVAPFILLASTAPAGSIVHIQQIDMWVVPEGMENTLQEWDDVNDPNITRPDDNATNSGLDGFIVDSNFIKTYNGGSPLFGTTRWWDRSNATDTIMNASAGKNGQPALRMQGNGATNTNCAEQTLIPVKQGDVIVVRISLQAEAAFNTAGEFTINIAERDKDGGSLVNYPIIDPLSPGYSPASWVVLEAYHTIVGSTTEFANVFISVAAAMTSADQIWVDKIQAWKIPSSSDNRFVAGSVASGAGGLLPNWNFSLEDDQGKPAGIQPVQNITSRTGLAFGDSNKNTMLLSHASDATIGYGYPAIPIDDKQVYEITIRHRSTGTPTNVLTLGMNEKSSALATGKTHIGTPSQGVVDLRTQFGAVTLGGVPQTSVAMPGASYVDDVLIYVPTVGTRFASWSMYNSAATTQDYEVDFVSIQPGVSETALDALNLTNGPAQAGADVTGSNTANDTSNVNGVPATTVEGNAQTGQDLTEDNVTVVHRSSVDDVEFDFNEFNRMDQGNTTLRNIPRGLIPGLARDGDSFTFTPAYDVPPVVQFGSGGIVYDSGNLNDTVVWGQNFRALNLTASGFDASLKLQELAGSPTLRTVTGAASPSTYDWEGNKSLAEEAWDDKYTFLYDIEVTGGPGDFGRVDFLTNSGSGYEVNETAFHVVNATAATQVVFKDGMGLNDDFAMDAFFTASGLFTGGNDPDYNVTYGTATAGAITSATPTGATDIPFTVIDNKDPGIVSS